MQIGVYEFPDLNAIDDDGFVAAGGDLLPATMIDAYQHGLFPWHNSLYGPCWYCPNPRMVLYPENLHVQKSMRPYLNGNRFTFTMNEAFSDVLEGCASVPREGQAGTWIWDEYREAMLALHEQGVAISGEAWENNTLVGGFYGLYMNGVLHGESMFSRTSNASKYAFIKMVKSLTSLRMVDCQVPIEHLKRLGAEEMSRDLFLSRLSEFRT